MRHKIAGKQLCLESDHRRAMLRNLAAGLFEHGQIVTTLPKAKAVQPFVEKLITAARKRSLASRRQITAKLTDRKVFAWVADKNVKEERKKSDFWELPSKGDISFNRYGELKKAPRLVQHLMTKVAPLFEGRAGGYTRIVKLDKRRLGDATDLVLLQLVGREVGAQVSGGQSGRRKQADKRSAFASKRRKGATAAAAAPETDAGAAPAADA
ncbi:MAG: 50S ribosomal protein L17 [Planctomycetota bacterium]|nr:50S ribosomal protein L17 [Planctomycetota bacterium]MDA1105271.1 50S ribosomal protein L17 [Planctomycetota bacterium]